MEDCATKKVVLFEYPICRHIYVFKTEKLFTFFGLVDSCVYVSKLTTDEVSGIPSLKRKFDGETLQHDKPVLGIFEFERKFYGVDQSGCTFTVTEEFSNDSAMDYDIFEDSPEKRERWVLKDKKDFLNGQEVINFCVTDKHLALLVNSEQDLSLEIIDFIEGLSVKSVMIRSPGLPKDKKLCTLIWVPPEENVKEFLKNWFFNFEGNDGIFILTMPEGNILVIDKSKLNPEFLFAWPFPVLVSDWTVAEDVTERALVLVTEGNAILKMTQFGEVVTEYLPINGTVKAALIKQELLYISDWSDTVKYSIINSKEKAYELCLKGILCFEMCEEFIFALSNNGEIYIICDNYKPCESEVILPGSSLTAMLMKETTILEKMNESLYECDAYIEATNLAMKNLPFSMNAQVIYARKLSYTICISIKCLHEGIIIEKHQSWNLFLTLKVGLEVITLSRKMRSNLGSGIILTDVFSFSVNKISIADLHVKAKLIYSRLPDFAKYVPVIYIGEVYLDPSYFLQPALEVELSEIEFQPYLKEIVKTDVDSALEKQEVLGNKSETKKEIKLRVDYSEEFSAGSVFKWLLSHSKPLWRSSLWSYASENKKIEVAISGHVIALEDCESHVLITGKEIHSCYALKRALLSSVPGTKELSLPFEAIKQLEIYERTSDLYLHENPSVEELEKLKEKLRKEITSHLRP